MSARTPTLQTLVGAVIRLEPMTRDHLPALYAAIGHPIVFAAGYGGGPAGYRDTLEGFVEWAETYYSWGRNNVYVVVVSSGPHADDVVGTTTLGDFDERNESAHIGWTAYDPRVWGTAVNAEAKRLLLGLAFDHGFGRVKIQADALNARSRAAISRLGATFEGIMRRDMVRADGSFRDSAMFSVIIDDWPHVRALLDERLAAHAGRPVLFRTMPTH
ncbi:GNAT family N-acetyltransferase [Marisediminicola sp. LYQ134]|uniref:GNAT family N-acetyltransferase n=1 Tax=Marisediminicola sp. LYQ134 TaxID=3391061 RepID=UPI003983364B